ncbi:MAG TPA: hypothetical protein VL285_06055 [Bryobacteraceae bacterium]|jgi:hypothetical protein|nr:hypothetical protein [Bryobacteraceae bacterium]
MPKRVAAYTLVSLCAALCQAAAQAPDIVTLEIEWENGVNYFGDNSDLTKLATSPVTVNANTRNFMEGTAIADIVSVNGKPAKGSWVGRAQLVMLFPNPAVGQAIGDIGRPVVGDLYIELLQADGTRIGTITGVGSPVGPPPPGSPPGFTGNLTVTGGTGAFLGARGMLTGPPYTFRAASMQEDPSNRRVNGGGRGRYVVYLIPMLRPEIVAGASGPGVLHADFSPVTPSRPARSGETIVLMATGLGPTRPGMAPGTPFPESPVQEVNSPLEVTLNGKSAEVLNKIGWPGMTGTYRLDIKVPDGTTPGMASLQVTSGFVPGPEVRVPIQ